MGDRSLAVAPEPGTLVAGRYRLGRVLGEGGCGVVLAAHDEVDGREIALKLLQVVGGESSERFWREARLASKLESEHVVRVLDTGLFQQHPFLVMERLYGQDFSAMSREAALPLARV